MGEARRRKKALGFAYGTPEGSNWKGRRNYEPEGVKIQIVARCNLEGHFSEGKAIMIDLGELDHPCLVQDELYEFSEIIEFPSDNPEKAPEIVCEYHFDVVETRGLGPRITALASDVEGPALGTLEDLVSVLLELPGYLWKAFFEWAETEEGDWWLPGYGVHKPEDAVFFFWSTCSSKQLKGWEPDMEPVVW